MSSLQETYSPRGRCFGCGPANPEGLRIQSHPEGDEVIARWEAREAHEAFEGYLSGGVIGALLDCHANWTAAWAIMQANPEREFPCTVTADFSVTMKRPTPARVGPVVLRARPVEVSGGRATVEATLEAGGKVCATLRGTFVAVKEGHPAWRRWGPHAD